MAKKKAGLPTKLKTPTLGRTGSQPLGKPREKQNPTRALKKIR